MTAKRRITAAIIAALALLGAGAATAAATSTGHVTASVPDTHYYG